MNTYHIKPSYLIIIALLAGLIFAAPVSAARNVRPVLECVRDNGDGTYSALFGYHNAPEDGHLVPIGTDNRFSPAPEDRGQPTEFYQGRQWGVFWVDFTGGTLVWSLNGRTATASANSKACAPPKPQTQAETYAVTYGQTLTITRVNGVLANDVSGSINPLTATVNNLPQFGSLVLNLDGSFTYTGNMGYSGGDLFTYIASDGAAQSDPVTVTLSISNAIPTAQNDDYSGAYGQRISQVAPGVLGNDQDDNGQAIHAVLVDGPTNAANFTFNADGSFDYTAEMLFVGLDQFTYQVSDGMDTSEVATVYLGVGVPTPTERVYPTPQLTLSTGLVPLYWGLTPNAQWYRVYIQGPEGFVYNKWYEAATACNLTTHICDGNLQYLANGQYTWWMTTWNPVDGVAEYDSATFTVDGAVPGTIQLTNTLDTTVAGDGTILQWQADAQAAWYRVVITGDNGYTFNKWYEVTDICNSGFCEVPDFWLRNGTYTLTLKAWAPEGMGLETQTSFSIAAQNPNPVAILTPVDGSTLTAGSVTLTWEDNDTVSWYRVYITNDTGMVVNKWVRGAEGCTAGTCSTTVQLSGGEYALWMTAWGPAGMAEWTGTTFIAQ